MIHIERNPAAADGNNPNLKIYPVLSFPQVNVFAMAESETITWNVPFVSSLVLSKWWFTAVCKN